MGEIKDSWNNAQRAGGLRHGPRPKKDATGERVSGDRRRARKRLMKYAAANGTAQAKAPSSLRTIFDHFGG
jgi:hypothetical protein